MTHEVVWHPQARNDLYDIYDWIADRADPAAALAFTSRIEAHVERLRDFPNRGTPRYQLSPGLRSTTFERRIIVTYRVEANEVLILRVIHAARDYAPLLEQ